jgi:hypothetical protein
MVRDLGLLPEKLRYCVQVHEGRVAVITDGERPGRLEGFDAVATNRPGVGLMTFSADCPLVLVYDPGRCAVGMAHASWRCTASAITQRLVEVMGRHFGCQPPELLAGVGPSAGPEAYEVGEDVYAAAERLPDHASLFVRRNGRLFLDLWEANRSQLERAGLRPENIEVAGVCTMTRTDLFYSYRREGAACGHFGLLAGVCVGAAQQA